MFGAAAAGMLPDGDIFDDLEIFSHGHIDVCLNRPLMLRIFALKGGLAVRGNGNRAGDGL